MKKEIGILKYMFIDNIKTIKSISEINDRNQLTEIPNDWYIGIVDIEVEMNQLDSITARNINAISGSAIAAVKNSAKNEKPLYAFSGDGAYFAFSGQDLDLVTKSLSAIQTVGSNDFNLNTLVGIVSYSDVIQYCNEIGSVDKCFVINRKLVNNTVQNMFLGGGIKRARELMTAESTKYLFKNGDKKDLDLEGFECRWDPVKPDSKSVLTIAIGSSEQDELPLINKIYSILSSKIRDKVIFKENALHLSLDDNKLTQEVKLKEDTATKDKPTKTNLRFSNFIINLFGWVTKYTANFEWEDYKKDLVQGSVTEQFSDLIYMFIPINTESEKNEIISDLEKLKNEEKIHFGYSESTELHITCIIFDRKSNHIHFLDGVDGSISRAKSMLKKAEGWDWL